jgi:hypothetical protein
VLIAKETGTRAAPEKWSFKNQCVKSTPGAIKRTIVLRKGMSGSALKTLPKGPSKTKAPVLDSTIVASSNRGRWLGLISLPPHDTGKYFVPTPAL